MTLKKFALFLALSISVSLPMIAQSGMTDSQVMQFMIRENERGTSRDQIVTKLIERGVSIDQIRRIRTNYERQKKGIVVGARDISGKSTGNDRTRKNNGDKREEKLEGMSQREDASIHVDESSMSAAQLKRYKREQKGEYLDEMEDLLPDSLENLKLPEDELRETKKKKK